MASDVKKRTIPNDRLAHERKKRQWTQGDLASELYCLCNEEELVEHGTIDGNMVSKWERGLHTPHFFWQRKLCQLFATTPDNLGLLESTTLAPPAPEALAGTNTAVYRAASVHEKLVGYLQQQRRRLFDALASGSTYLRVSDILGEQGLFVPPPWEETLGSTMESDLAQHLAELLSQRQHILLLGEAGQGKTTMLKRVFANLVDRFMQGSEVDVLFPLYVSLREITEFAGSAVDLLWEQVRDEFPCSYDDFAALVRSRRVLLLLDGFDEIRGDITQHLVNERAASKMFSYPSLLSCRKSFFDFYLARSPLHELYAHHVELLSFALNDPVKQYVGAFCQQKQRRGNQHRIPSPEEVIEVLETNQELRELAQRPLLLLMILEVFTSTRQMGDERWTVNTLYRNYTEQWLKVEAAKPDSVLRWSEKAALLQDVAWHTYHALSQHVTFTYDELAACIHEVRSRYPGKIGVQLVDDLCFRTLLTHAEGERYTFLHKSFQEYFVARYVFECMRSRDPHAQTAETIEQALQTSLPFDVATFLKHMLKESAPGEKELVTTNLMQVYQRNSAEEQHSITIRQQASHYLTCLDWLRAIQFLEQVWEHEPSKWVQRGVMVGLAYYSQRVTMLERYIHIIGHDPEAAAINLGYHLIYYGDLAPGSDYQGQQVEQCEKTVAALFRHLQDTHYQNGWTLDILTLSTLVKQKSVSILQENQWHFLTTFFRHDHSGLGDLFQQEIAHLKAIIEGATKWN